jgi:hypothetical protein
MKTHEAWRMLQVLLEIPPPKAHRSSCWSYLLRTLLKSKAVFISFISRHFALNHNKSFTSY